MTLEITQITKLVWSKRDGINKETCGQENKVTKIDELEDAEISVHSGDAKKTKAQF